MQKSSLHANFTKVREFMKGRDGRRSFRRSPWGACYKTLARGVARPERAEHLGARKPSRKWRNREFEQPRLEVAKLRWGGEQKTCAKAQAGV